MRSKLITRVAALLLLLGILPVVTNLISDQFTIPDECVPALFIAGVILLGIVVVIELRPARSGEQSTELVTVRAALLDQWREEYRLLGLRERGKMAIPWRYEGPVRRRMLGTTTRTKAQGRTAPDMRLVHAITVEGARRIVLTGPRGSGKSVALMLTAMQLASSTDPLVLPLMIGLKSWGRQTSTIDLAAQALVSNFSGRMTHDQAKEIVRQASTSGGLILMLDELDELDEERKIELLDSLRAHSVPFVLCSETPLLQPAVADLVEGFARLELRRVPWAAASRYLGDSPSGVAWDRLRRLERAWERSGAVSPASPFAEPLSISIIRDIIERTSSAPAEDLEREMTTGFADRVRSFLLRWYVEDRTGDDGPRAADLRAVFLMSHGQPQTWWQMGDRVPILLRALLALVLGAAGGALVLFSLPIAGASLGAAFLLVRALRSGRAPVVFSLRATTAMTLRMLPAAVLGGAVGLGLILWLNPTIANGGFPSELAAGNPIWAQLLFGPALVVAHFLNSGLVLVGHRGRKNGGALGPVFYGTRSLVGAIILTFFGTIGLGIVPGPVTGILLAAFGAAMARSERTTVGIRAVTPHVSYRTDRRNGWLEALGFGVILTAGCLVAFVPVSGSDGAVQAVLLGVGAAVGNSVATAPYGRWRLYTWPYIAARRGAPIGVWRTVERFHALGIIKYSGSAILLRHSSLWSVLPAGSPRENP